MPSKKILLELIMLITSISKETQIRRIVRSKYQNTKLEVLLGLNTIYFLTTIFYDKKQVLIYGE